MQGSPLSALTQLYGRLYGDQSGLAFCTSDQHAGQAEDRAEIEKWEWRWYLKNRELVDLPMKFSDSEQALLEEWT